MIKMQTARISLLALVLSILLVSCSGIPPRVDSKYEFPQFKQVDKILSYDVDSWQAVDNQSLVVQTSPSKFYLLILRRPLHELRFAEVIELSSTGPSIYAKFDCVKVYSRHCGPDPIAVSIHKIYALQGRQQVQVAKQQIKQEIAK